VFVVSPGGGGGAAGDPGRAVVDSPDLSNSVCFNVSCGPFTGVVGEIVSAA